MMVDITRKGKSKKRFEGMVATARTNPTSIIVRPPANNCRFVAQGPELQTSQVLFTSKSQKSEAKLTPPHHPEAQTALSGLSL